MRRRKPLPLVSAKPIGPERVASRSPIQDSGRFTVLRQDCLGRPLRPENNSNPSECREA